MANLLMRLASNLDPFGPPMLGSLEASWHTLGKTKTLCSCCALIERARCWNTLSRKLHTKNN